MWKLVIKDEEGRQIVVPLKLDEYIMGRKAGNKIRLIERNVSRQHAKLTKVADPTGNTPDTFTLEDLGSQNGTFVNGQRAKEKKALAHGDLIQIGDYRITLQDDMAGDLPPPRAAIPEPEYDPDG
jgi:pSer/pThr/pTyr-binding forkhead associated (FHA) protein